MLLALEAMPSHKAFLAEYAAKSSYVRDLLVSNPILLWGLCEYGFLNEITLDKIDALTSKKQRALCAYLKLEGTKQQVRLIKRVADVAPVQGRVTVIYPTAETSRSLQLLVP